MQAGAFMRLGHFVDAEEHCHAALGCNHLRGDKGVAMVSSGLFSNRVVAVERVIKTVLASREQRTTINETQKESAHFKLFAVVRVLLQQAEVSLLLGDTANAGAAALQAVILAARCDAHSRSLALGLGMVALLAQSGAVGESVAGVGNRLGRTMSMSVTDASAAAEAEALACGHPKSVASVQYFIACCELARAQWDSVHQRTQQASVGGSRVPGPSRRSTPRAPGMCTKNLLAVFLCFIDVLSALL